MMHKETNANIASDIQVNSWLMTLAPKAAHPYLYLMRADRPIGTWLLLLPCLWSLSASSKIVFGVAPDPWYILLFAIGAFVMRGAGCVINDLWDRDLDGQVARTAERPIASGVISVPKAFIFLAILLLIGLLVLIQFNLMTIVLGISSLVLVAAYPFMKRITYWPQAFLGLTFNWGALLAWVAVTENLSLVPVLIYVAGIAWTLGYDTVYGHQDKADDIVVGVKSASIKLGKHTYLFVALVYATTTILLASVGVIADLGWFFYLMLGAAAMQFIWQVTTLDIDEPANCLARFKSNRDVGLLIFLGFLFS